MSGKKRMVTASLGVGIFFLLWATLFSFEPLFAAGLKEQVFETVLPNGLKVILLENHKAPLISFHVCYRVGSRNEDWGKTGLSHMLEHMMFKGTQKVAGEEFSRIIQENGGNQNAFTTHDYTAYFVNISADRLQVTMDLEADRMQNLLLREEDFHPERGVVMEERRLRTEDDPQSVLLEQLLATAFQAQPYHWPIIGWMQDIQRFTLEDLKNYYKTYYNPANAFLVAVGDFRTKELLARIEKTFGSIPGGKAPDQERDKDPQQIGERRISVKKEAQLPSLIMGYRVPNVGHPDGYVLEIISALLAGGKSSRFYQDLVQEKRLVLDADAENSLLSRDPDLFFLSASVLPGKELGAVEKALDQEIEKIQKEPVGNRELEKAKNQLESAFIYSQDSMFRQAMLLARYEVTPGWKVIDEYVPSIRKVTPDDIQRVARLYLTPENRTIGLLIPLPAKKGEEKPVGPPMKERVVR